MKSMLMSFGRKKQNPWDGLSIYTVLRRWFIQEFRLPLLNNIFSMHTKLLNYYKTDCVKYSLKLLHNSCACVRGGRGINTTQNLWIELYIEHIVPLEPELPMSIEISKDIASSVSKGTIWYENTVKEKSKVLTLIHGTGSGDAAHGLNKSDS